MVNGATLKIIMGRDPVELTKRAKYKSIAMRVCVGGYTNTPLRWSKNSEGKMA